MSVYWKQIILLASLKFAQALYSLSLFQTHIYEANLTRIVSIVAYENWSHTEGQTNTGGRDIPWLPVQTPLKPTDTNLL